MTNPLTAAFKKLLYSDSWENAVTALGTAYASLSWHKMTAGAWLTAAELENLYVEDPIARRIITQPVEATFKKGFRLTPPADINGDTAQEQEEALLDALTSLQAVDKIQKAIFWGRLYGRGALLLGAKDGIIDPEQPLNEDSVRELAWLQDITMDEFAPGRLNADTSSPMYGEPEIWSVSKSSGSQEPVHESRLILTGAVPTSRQMRQDHEWRDIPLLQAVRHDLRNYDSAKTGMAQMLVDSSQAVLKIMNLPGILADDDTVIKGRLRILEMARALHIMPINAGGSGTEPESFEYVERSFTGVADTFDRLLGTLASSVGWPQTYLFGRSPAGENATGESDREIWDDLVLQIQNDACQEPLQRVVDLLVTANGFTPGWWVTFAPLRQMSELETAQYHKTIAETDHIQIQDGVLDETTIALWRYGGDEANFEPVSLSPEMVEAMKALQDVDIDRSRGEDLEPEIEGKPMVEPTQEPAEAVNPTTALNGAQVEKAVDIVNQVASRMLPRESGLAMLQQFYPLDQVAAEQVMGPVGLTWFVQATPVAPSSSPFEPEIEPETEEESEEDSE